MRVSSFTKAVALFAAVWTLATLSPGTSAATVRPTRPDVVNRAPSRCDKKCETAKSPVCGTNDVTYDSYCLYNVASCKNKTLAVAYMKACVNRDADGGDDDVRTSAPVTKPPSATKAPAAVVVVEVKDELQAEQVQAFEASVDHTREEEEERAEADYCAIKCSSVENFVCGSDGLTYTNECILLAAKCTNPKLKLVSTGKCPVGTDKCARYCTREYEPVCGSDGVTYGNACTFAEANCRAGGSLKVVTKCACPTPKPSHTGVKCGDVKCEPHEKCIADQLQKNRKYCAELCDAANGESCKKKEVCVLSQVVCKKAPCPKQPTCVQA